MLGQTTIILSRAAGALRQLEEASAGGTDTAAEVTVGLWRALEDVVKFVAFLADLSTDWHPIATVFGHLDESHDSARTSNLQWQRASSEFHAFRTKVWPHVRSQSNDKADSAILVDDLPHDMQQWIPVACETVASVREGLVDFEHVAGDCVREPSSQVDKTRIVRLRDLADRVSWSLNQAMRSLSNILAYLVLTLKSMKTI
jgi:hypothetical protein